MATPRHSDDTLRAALDAVAAHGSISAAARALGMPRLTLQSRVQEARGRLGEDAAPAPQPVPSGFTAPVLPEEEEPLDATVARLEREQERREAARSAAEWMRFEVAGEAPFCLAFVGDPHVDVCDIRRLRGHLDLIEQTPRMWAVGLGDWVNGWAGRLRSQYAMQSVTEAQAYRLAQWLLGKPIWWLLLLGNHDGQRWHGHGSPLRWMETAAAVPAVDWQAKFTVGCGGREWRVWAAHDFPGNSQFNAGHGAKKRALWTGAVADLFIAGDHHTFTLAQDQHEHTGKVYWTARARGYKPLDDYAREKGHGEQNIGHSIGAVFDPRDGTLTCFADLQKAAEYLAFLNRPRVRVKAGRAA